MVALQVTVDAPGDLDIAWPHGDEGAAARRWLTPLLAEGTGAMLANAPCDVGVVRRGL